MASRGPGRAVSRLLLDPRLEPTYGCHEVPVVQIEGMAPVGEVHAGYDPLGHQEDGGVSSSLSAVDGDGGVVEGGADLGQDRFRLTGERWSRCSSRRRWWRSRDFCCDSGLVQRLTVPRLTPRRSAIWVVPTPSE